MRPIIATAIALGAMAAGVGVTAMASDGGTEQSASADEMYLKLRTLALNMAAADLGLRPGRGEPYGIVMEMDFGGRTATITSFATGDASLYLSTGGGTIGAGDASAEVAAAAKEFVAVAARHRGDMEQTDAQPRPGPGQVSFHVLTPEGRYSASRPQQALGEGRDRLSPLFYAGQEVLTQMRLLQERQEAK